MKKSIWYITEYGINDNGEDIPTCAIEIQATDKFIELALKHNHYPNGSYFGDDEFHKYFKVDKKSNPAEEIVIEQPVSEPIEQQVKEPIEEEKQQGRPRKGDPNISSRNTKAEIKKYLLDTGVDELLLEGLTKKELLTLYDK